ncbi:MAG: hypothetical protein UZ21_OP11001000423 [Microgenomates bacterium OLB22]|nr:MAG: hypothetical protein UZ21_OP11001000423 [Microgenomates bacterium OLB22]
MIGHTKLLLLVGGAALTILLLRTLLIPVANTLPNTLLTPEISAMPTAVPVDPTIIYANPTTRVESTPRPTDPIQIAPPPTNIPNNPKPTEPEDNASGPRPQNACTTNADCGGGCWRCDTNYGRCVTVCNNEP